MYKYYYRCAKHRDKLSPILLHFTLDNVAIFIHIYMYSYTAVVFNRAEISNWHRPMGIRYGGGDQLSPLYSGGEAGHTMVWCNIPTEK